MLDSKRPTIKIAFSFLLIVLLQLLSDRPTATASTNSHSHTQSTSKSNVFQLNTSSFYELLGQGSGDEIWLIEFYAPWCSHCKRFASAYENVAKDLQGKVKVAKVDGTEVSCFDFTSFVEMVSDDRSDDFLLGIRFVDAVWCE